MPAACRARGPGPVAQEPVVIGHKESLAGLGIEKSSELDPQDDWGGMGIGQDVVHDHLVVVAQARSADQCTACGSSGVPQSAGRRTARHTEGPRQ